MSTDLHGQRAGETALLAPATARLSWGCAWRADLSRRTPKASGIRPSDSLDRGATSLVLRGAVREDRCLSARSASLLLPLLWLWLLPLLWLLLLPLNLPLRL
jgi:hypothetical protein